MPNRKEQPGAGLVEFGTVQQSFELGGVCFGGQPGVRPTALIGSIFYHGDKVTTDEHRGEFDADEARRLIHEQEELSERTGNPCMLDVVGATPEAIERHLEFAHAATSMPLLLDGTTTDVRLAGLEYVAKAGVADRVVYNSIQPGIHDDELEAIHQAGVTSARILTYDLQDFTAKGRIETVRKLLPRVKEAGVNKIFIDTCVVDLASMGQALSAIHDVKEEFGVPAGGGFHNAVAVWRGLKNKFDEEARVPCLASAAAAAAAIGADFVLYGPLGDAKYVFPAVAMIDTAHSQIVLERGIRPAENHPRVRIG